MNDNKSSCHSAHALIHARTLVGTQMLVVVDTVVSGTVVSGTVVSGTAMNGMVMDGMVMSSTTVGGTTGGTEVGTAAGGTLMSGTAVSGTAVGGGLGQEVGAARKDGNAQDSQRRTTYIRTRHDTHA